MATKVNVRRAGAALLLVLVVGAAWFVWWRPTPIEPAQGGPAERTARNVLLITIDTLRADAVGAYGERHERTPALDSIAVQGTLFLRAYATAPITLTSYDVGILLGFGVFFVVYFMGDGFIEGSAWYLFFGILFLLVIVLLGGKVRGDPNLVIRAAATFSSRASSVRRLSRLASSTSAWRTSCSVAWLTSYLFLAIWRNCVRRRRVESLTSACLRAW